MGRTLVKKINEKEEIKAVLLTALRDIDCYLFLFGSQVSKKIHDRSDFDVGILEKSPLDFGLRARLRGYMEAIPALIDIVDFYNVGDDFKKIALRHIEIWKRPKNPKGFKFNPEMVVKKVKIMTSS